MGAINRTAERGIRAMVRDIVNEELDERLGGGKAKPAAAPPTPVAPEAPAKKVRKPKAK